MKIGFNTFQDNPQAPAGFPLAWPWQIIEVPEGDEETFSQGRPGNWLLVNSAEEFLAYKVNLLPAYEAYLTSLTTKTQKAAAYQSVYQLMTDAEAYGKHIIRSYATQNIINGVDQKIIDAVLIKFVDAYIKDALDTGSLKIAKERIAKLDEDAIVTAELKAYFINEIDKFLNRPR